MFESDEKVKHLEAVEKEEYQEVTSREGGQDDNTGIPVGTQQKIQSETTNSESSEEADDSTEVSGEFDKKELEKTKDEANKTESERPQGVALLSENSVKKKNEVINAEIEEGTVENDLMKKLDPSILIAPKAQPIKIAAGGAGVMSIVNSPKNGRRFLISKDVYIEMGKPSSVNIAFTNDSIVIGTKIPVNRGSYPVGKLGNKAVIYATPLIKEATELFNIDFSDGRVCRTFYDVDYALIDYCIVAMFKMI